MTHSKAGKNIIEGEAGIWFSDWYINPSVGLIVNKRDTKKKFARRKILEKKTEKGSDIRKNRWAVQRGRPKLTERI